MKKFTSFIIIYIFTSFFVCIPQIEAKPVTIKEVFERESLLSRIGNMILGYVDDKNTYDNMLKLSLKNIEYCLNDVKRAKNNPDLLISALQGYIASTLFLSFEDGKLKDEFINLLGVIFNDLKKARLISGTNEEFLAEYEELASSLPSNDNASLEKEKLYKQFFEDNKAFSFFIDHMMIACYPAGQSLATNNIPMNKEVFEKTFKDCEALGASMAGINAGNGPDGDKLRQEMVDAIDMMNEKPTLSAYSKWLICVAIESGYNSILADNFLKGKGDIFKWMKKEAKRRWMIH